jgi:hypothetical protein
MFAALGSLLIGSGSHYGLLYVSSFERSEYQVDEPLDGQDGWTALVSPDAAVVVDGWRTAALGRRAIACWGGGPLEDVGGGLLDGAWEQVIDFDPITTPAIVRVEASVRLDGPDTGSGPNDDLASANLYARNGAGRSAFFYLSSNGNAYAFANSASGNQGYKFETPIKQGAYNHLAITLNYLTHMATFEVNCVTVGSLPFGGAGEQFRGVLLEFAAYEPLLDPTLYTGYWDNVLVRAKKAK